MKNFLLMVVAAILGAGAVLVLGVFTSGTSKSANGESAGPAASATSVAKPGSDDQVAKLKGNVDALSTQVAQLSSELERLRSSSDRAPASGPSALDAKLPSGDEVATLSPKARDEVVDVLAQEFKRQEEQRAAEKLEKEKAAAAKRAERAAKQLNISGNDVAKLADYYVVANQKRRDMFTAMQDGDVDRETMMQNMQDLRTWSKDELTKQFGAALADQIEGLDRQGWGGPGGGPGGGFGRGNRGGGGQGGPGGGGNGNGDK